MGAPLDGYSAKYSRMKRTLDVLDITHDLGIPTFAASSVSRKGGATDLVIGFGAHVDAHIAVARAVTEVDQWLSSLVAGTASARISADPGCAAYLAPSGSEPHRTADHYRCDVDNVTGAIDLVVDRLRQVGVEALVLDQTRTDIGLPVVRVTAPGLRHFWPRFGSGRLYSVPLACGWQREPHAEDDLNPSQLLV